MLSHSFKLLFPVYFICFLSLVTLAGINMRYFWLQFSWIILGTLVIIAFWRFDLRSIINDRLFIVLFYFLSLLLLLIAFFLFSPIRSVRGWISLGFFNFQPVELSKLSLILFFAYFFAKKHIGIARISNIIIPFFIFLIPAAVVLKQPDLGSVLVMFGIWIGFLLTSGLRLKHLFFGSAILIFGFCLAWFSFLANYQKERIIGVFYPESDPLGVNYNVIQSKIAIGSSGFFGKGFKQGSQVQLGFLPESHNDFIFAALSEEWGLIGGFSVITTFFLLCVEIIYVGRRLALNNFDRFFCLGSALVLIIHFFINTGSATGFSPVIGLPFPFLSYGGSNLLTNFSIVAIVNAIALRSS
ncbi:MAG: hypothetical protein A2430_00895 [Candidatus Liptonbacteria bacterium RIFOXYC1_FULL_36_8]|uniref:Rod shape-determining protein RodA n=2 Tax=Candidatus Liptoniibacteriota TaxID=1817909 RepID=A0A1G2CSZ8_9BACT|nr:MAG: hypothetical protein A2430_00895 [Candidatus Liptonbacteria bacterium RIFOXYC1_FULL_36_8]OGZ04294.1 MAG: hypothetical protein A2604_00790 [Candidatus Liptonbacteria bacterium RIFOXYD1_FULL_36_11]